MRNSAIFRRGQNARDRIKKVEAAEKKLADWIISVQVLENGARYYKLKPGPALGCEFMDSLLLALTVIKREIAHRTRNDFSQAFHIGVFNDFGDLYKAIMPSKATSGRISTPSRYILPCLN